jgi:chaperonin GroEL
MMTLDSVEPVVDGLNFFRGYLSTYYINFPQTAVVDLENAYVLVSNDKISSTMQMLEITRMTLATGRPLLVIASEMDQDVVALLATQSMFKGLLAAVQGPFTGTERTAMMQDIAIVTGAAVVSEAAGLALCDVTLANLGQVQRAYITVDDTTLAGGAGLAADVNARIDQVRAQMGGEISDYALDKLQNRQTQLLAGLRTLRA